MSPKVFRYDAKSPLLIGLLFLVAFPIVVGLVVWLLGLAKIKFVVYLLALIYLADVIIVAWSVLTAWDKQIELSDESIRIKNKISEQEYFPNDISEITLLASRHEHEFLRIRTQKQTFYIDESYQPWNTLIDQIESFARKHQITGNLTD